jgi:hypothetical protein
LRRVTAQKYAAFAERNVILKSFSGDEEFSLMATELMKTKRENLRGVGIAARYQPFE